jgi:hypothetical protein
MPESAQTLHLLSAPSTSLPCWSIWKSSRLIVGLMFPMTIPSPNRTLRRLNIVLTSRIASAASRMPGLTARHSLPGTTPSIVIQVSLHIVHYGGAPEITRTRSATLDAAFLAHPERFRNVAPRPPELPVAPAWINPPKKKEPQTRIKLDACSLNVNTQVSQTH